MNGAVAGNLAMRGRARGGGALRDTAIRGRLRINPSVRNRGVTAVIVTQCTLDSQNEINSA